MEKYLIIRHDCIGLEICGFERDLKNWIYYGENGLNRLHAEVIGNFTRLPPMKPNKDNDKHE
jgi:hypothetical protein